MGLTSAIRSPTLRTKPSAHAIGVPDTEIMTAATAAAVGVAEGVAGPSEGRSGRAAGVTPTRWWGRGESPRADQRDTTIAARLGGDEDALVGTRRFELRTP